MANYIHVPPGSPEVPKLNVTVQDQEEQRCREGALSLLQHLRPHWDPQEVTLQRWGLMLSSRLECSGTMIAHCSLVLLSSSNPFYINIQIEMGFHHVGQAGLKLLASSDLPALASQSTEIIGGLTLLPRLECSGVIMAHYSLDQLFTDGITNKLIGCYVGNTMEDVVLRFSCLSLQSRLGGTTGAHDLAWSVFVFSVEMRFHHVGQAVLNSRSQVIRLPQPPKVLGLQALIARQLAKIHAIHAHNGWIPKSNLWLKMGKYFSLIPTGFADEDINKRFLSDIPSSQILQEEMTWMKEILSNLGSPVVLCHNDLLCKNIIYNEKQGDVQFIDYEYSGYNYLAYDIGNHFNEFAGVSDVDYSLYPDRELQSQWLRSYLEAYKEFKGFGTEVTEKEVEILFIQVNQFAL
ncbi:Ethanolamine kinase 1, partial [Plecturocebus cupreus]